MLSYIWLYHELSGLKCVIAWFEMCRSHTCVCTLSAYCLFCLARPAAACGLYVLLLFLIHLFFDDFRQTSYVKIYWINCRQIFRVGRTVGVDDQAEISFLIPQGTLPWRPVLSTELHRICISVVLSTELIGWT